MWTIALSPDEKHVAVGGNASAIRVLDMADGKVLGGFKNPNFQVKALAFHKDGKLISADGALRIWDLADMRPIDAPKEPVVVKKDVPKETPKAPETIEYKGAILKHFEVPVSTFEADGKTLRIEPLRETELLDATGAAIPENSPRRRILANPGNVVDLQVRSEGGRQLLLKMKLVRAISEVPSKPGNFELKAAKVKQYGARRMILTDETGKEHPAIVDALAICHDKTGAILEGMDYPRIFKTNNVVDVWLYPEPGREFNHVNVARLVSGELMTDAELKAPAPEPARTEKLTGKLEVRDADGTKSYTLGVPGLSAKKKRTFTHRNLKIEGDPKAFDMTGKPVPWATIFHHNNTLEVVMETRGVISTVKEAKLISGVVK